MDGISAPGGPEPHGGDPASAAEPGRWLEDAPVLLWVADDTGACVWFNRMWLAFTGRTLEQERGSGWVEGVHPDDREACRAVVSDGFKRRAPFRAEYRLRRADGVHRWVEVVGVPRQTSDGAFAGFIGSCTDIAEHRRVVADLRAAQERLGLAQTAGGVGVWEYDVEAGRLTWTDEQKRLFGLEPEAPPPDFATFEGSIHPEDRGPMRRAAAAAWEAGVYEVEFRREFPGDVEPRSYIARGRVIRDAAGRPARMVGVNVEVTARRAAEERRNLLADLGDLLVAPLDARALFHAVAVLLGSRLKASACAFYELDYPARLMRLYPVWAAKGFPLLEGPLPLGDYDVVLDELLGGRLVAVADTATDPRIDDRYRQVLHASATRAFVTVPLRRDGALSSCLTVLSAAPRTWTADEVELIRAAAERTWLAAENSRLSAERDRTVAALMEAREALAGQVVARTRERNRVFDLSTELIAVLELDGMARVINPAWSALLGLSEADILARPLARLIHPDDREEAARLMTELREGRAVARYDNRIRTADGGWRWMAWTAVSDGDAAYIVGRDITAERLAADALREANARLEAEMAERARIQEQLLQAQKMEAVGQLTGGVAHDFNNLLQVITGALSLIDEAEPPRRRRLTEAMRQAAERGEGLTRQLLAFSRRSALKPETIDLVERVETLRELLDRSLRGDVRLETRFAPGLSPVEADAGEFELALLNIAFNARDAMPGGGVITVSAEEVERFDDAELSGRFVRLSVSDTGEGMAPEVLARVFEPFFTTKEVGKGSGLGLSQVYGFAQQSGGGVRIESVPGEGTTVSLYLPRSPHRTAAAQPRSAPASVATPVGGRVLLVEDDDAVAELACEMIGALGYDCVRADDAATALTILRREPIDLVLSDIMMPGGVSGLDLARRVRRLKPGLPVVLATGFSAAAADARREGLTVLSKPYNLDTLRAALAPAASRGHVRDTEGTAA